MGILASIFFGFVPMFLFAGFINWIDRYEKEPKLLLAAVFLWGALVASAGAFFINTLFGISIYTLTGSEAAADLTTSALSRSPRRRNSEKLRRFARFFPCPARI